MKDLIKKYLEPTHSKKTIQEDINKIHGSIIFPDFEYEKIEIPINIQECISRINSGVISSNDEFEVIRFLDESYQKQLIEYTLQYVESLLNQRNKKRENNELVYCAFEYLTKLNE